MSIFSRNNTSLITEIQSLAMTESSNIVDLLRQCLVVSKKLKLPDFEKWVNSELSGYDNPDDVPKYRIIKCTMHLHNPYNGLIPLSIEDAVVEEYFTRKSIVQSVGSLKSLLNRHVDGFLRLPLSGEEIAYINNNTGGYNLPPVRQSSVSHIHGILDSIRNNILQLALGFEEAGIVGEGMSFSNDEKKQANELKNITIENFQGVFGNVTGSTINQTNSIEIKKNDFESLARHLKDELGVEFADIGNLRNAIEEDAKATSLGKQAYGVKVSEWIGYMVSKAASGSWLVGIGAAGGFLGTALSKFYGF
jgi:hypothetical protein